MPQKSLNCKCGNTLILSESDVHAKLRCPSCGANCSVPPLANLGNSSSKRIGLVAQFLWFWLLPHCIVVPLLWFAIITLANNRGPRGLGEIMNELMFLATIGSIPFRVFLPVGIVALLLVFVPWKTRVFAFMAGLLFLIFADGLGSLAVIVSQPTMDGKF
jgi:hypothetical protein